MAIVVTDRRTHLAAVGLQHQPLGSRLAAGVGHGVLHLVRRLLVAPAGGEKEAKVSQSAAVGGMFSTGLEKQTMIGM